MVKACKQQAGARTVSQSHIVLHGGVHNLPVVLVVTFNALQNDSVSLEIPGRGQLAAMPKDVPLVTFSAVCVSARIQYGGTFLKPMQFFFTFLYIFLYNSAGPVFVLRDVMSFTSYSIAVALGNTMRLVSRRNTMKQQTWRSKDVLGFDPSSSKEQGQGALSYYYFFVYCYSVFFTTDIAWPQLLDYYLATFLHS